MGKPTEKSMADERHVDAVIDVEAGFKASEAWVAMREANCRAELAELQRVKAIQRATRLRTAQAAGALYIAGGVA